MKEDRLGIGFKGRSVRVGLLLSIVNRRVFGEGEVLGKDSRGWMELMWGRSGSSMIVVC